MGVTKATLIIFSVRENLDFAKVLFISYESRSYLPGVSAVELRRNLSNMYHYNDVIMGTIASQITSLTIVYSTVYWDADQRKLQSSASLDFVRAIHRGPVNFTHKWSVTRKMFPFDDVIMRDIQGNQCFDYIEKRGNKQNAGNLFSKPHPRENWSRNHNKTKHDRAICISIGYNVRLSQAWISNYIMKCGVKLLAHPKVQLCSRWRLGMDK